MESHGIMVYHGIMVEQSERTRELVALLKEVSALQSELAEAVGKGDDARAEHVLRDLGMLERRRNRLVHFGSAAAPAYSTVRSLRDQVIQALSLLGRPAALNLISDVSRARWGEIIPTKRMASLRRDEQSSYQNRPGARPQYIAAALSADRFAPLRGVAALSSWPLEIRIVGPASPRVDLLHNLKKLCIEVENGRSQQSPWTAAMERLVSRLAFTVPDAMADAGRISLNTEQVRRACTTELAAIEASDSEVRRQQAERARAQLTQNQQLFGVQMRILSEEQASGGTR